MVVITILNVVILLKIVVIVPKPVPTPKVNVFVVVPPVNRLLGLPEPPNPLDQFLAPTLIPLVAVTPVNFLALL